jgi:hypothetical protein
MRVISGVCKFFNEVRPVDRRVGDRDHHLCELLRHKSTLTFGDADAIGGASVGRNKTA